MKAYVVIMNSLMLALMMGLAVLQQACTPISPSLDRRLLMKRTPSLPPPIPGVDSQLNNDASSREELTSKATLVVEIPSAIITDSSSDESGVHEECSLTVVPAESVKIFKDVGFIEVSIEKAKEAKFEMLVSLTKQEAKSFTAQDVELKLKPVSETHKWVMSVNPAVSYSLAQQIKRNVKSIHWQICKEQSLTVNKSELSMKATQSLP